MKPYLKRFLEELPNQTYFNKMEVVLDHNDPDDEEIEWIKEFQKIYPGRIKHIIVQPVEVIGASMNRCIKEAQGLLVTIWNVDDLRTPNSIELQVNAINKKNADVAIGDYKIVRNFGEKEKGEIVKHSHIPHAEFLRSMHYGPFVMFRKSLCEKAGYFDEQLTSGADFDLSVRLAYNGRTAVADGLLGYYLNEGKGASTRPDSKQALDKAVICLRYGIFDKVDVSFLPKILHFSIPHIIAFGKWNKVKDFVPEYNTMINHNLPLFNQSLFRSAVDTLFNYSKIKLTLKNQIKKIVFPKT